MGIFLCGGLDFSRYLLCFICLWWSVAIAVFFFALLCLFFFVCLLNRFLAVSEGDPPTLRLFQLGAKQLQFLIENKAIGQR